MAAAASALASFLPLRLRLFRDRESFIEQGNHNVGLAGAKLVGQASNGIQGIDGHLDVHQSGRRGCLCFQVCESQAAASCVCHEIYLFGSVSSRLRRFLILCPPYRLIVCGAQTLRDLLAVTAVDQQAAVLGDHRPRRRLPTLEFGIGFGPGLH